MIVFSFLYVKVVIMLFTLGIIKYGIFFRNPRRKKIECPSKIMSIFGNIKIYWSQIVVL